MRHRAVVEQDDEAGVDYSYVRPNPNAAGNSPADLDCGTGRNYRAM